MLDGSKNRLVTTVVIFWLIFHSGEKWWAFVANLPAGNCLAGKFIHAFSYAVLSGLLTVVLSAGTSRFHLEARRALDVPDNSFQFSRPRKACIPTRHSLVERLAPAGASWKMVRPRVKSWASLDNSLFSHAPARAFISAVLTRLASSWIANYFNAAYNRRSFHSHLPKCAARYISLFHTSRCNWRQGSRELNIIIA